MFMLLSVRNVGWLVSYVRRKVGKTDRAMRKACPLKSTKNLPVAVLSSADPWSTLPITRAQLWPLTWPPSPVCCQPTSASEQQREEITSDTASARCPKPRFPLPHVAAFPEEGKVHRLVPLGFCWGSLNATEKLALCVRIVFRIDTKLFLEIRHASTSQCANVLLHICFAWNLKVFCLVGWFVLNVNRSWHVYFRF